MATSDDAVLSPSWSLAATSENVTMATLPSNVTETDMYCPNQHVFKLGLYGIAMGVLSIAGFTGNALSFLVLQRDRSTPVASFLLQSLAVADNIFLVMWVIHYSVRSSLKYLDHASPMWIYVRVYTWPIMYMAQMQTIWATVVIALNRFMAVCLPYRAPHLCNITNVYKEVFLVTVFSIAYNVPRFFEQQISWNNGTLSVDRTALGNNALYNTVYTDAFYYVYSFILPLLILAFVNTRVIIVYRATQKRRLRMTSSVRRCTESENNITLVMIMVVLIFIVCQAPARFVQIILDYKTNCRDVSFYLIHFSNMLEVANSSVNFLIYCVFHKRFRDIMRRDFCRCLGLGGRRDAQRVTTTEGLSLEEIARTTQHSTRHHGNHTATTVTAVPEANNGQVKGESCQNLADSSTEPQDDALQPLAP